MSKIPDLIAEIKDELSQVETGARDIKEVSAAFPLSGREQVIYKESLALKLHNFYTGCERIFQKIADEINGGRPHSPDWHRRLLRSMALEIEDMRPPAISMEIERALEEFLAFRHVVRNVYGFEIDPERLLRLADKTEALFEGFKAEISRFVNFLNRLDRASEA